MRDSISMWNLSFKDSSSIKRFQNTLEYQNRNTQNTKTKTQRTPEQNHKEHQNRNTKEQPTNQKKHKVTTNQKQIHEQQIRKPK